MATTTLGIQLRRITIQHKAHWKYADTLSWTAWQKEYMHALAKVVSEKQGRILELGFGLELSSGFIQHLGVDEHIIVEPNYEVFEKLMRFKSQYKSKIIPILAKWQEILHLFSPQSFDGILFDASPMSDTELHQRQFLFLEQAKPLLKKEGIFTYCNVTSWGNLMKDYPNAKTLFDQTQRLKLEDMGFHRVSCEILNVNPGEGCKYRFDTLPIPKVQF